MARHWITLLCAGALFANAYAQDEQEGPAFVWYPTAECPEQKEGPGATPATAIALEDFEAIYSDVLDGIEKDNEADAETPSESQYECRWVTLSGFFRWTDYYHYRGTLYEDFPSAYFGGPGAVRYIVESFRDPAERRARINGARVKLTGRFYDLCRRAAMDVPADTTLVFGPCHYGDTKGLMLKDVIVEEIEAGPKLRLSGEQNRGLVGDLVAAPANWRETPAIKTAFSDWLRALRSGRESYWKIAIAKSPSKPEEKEKELADALADEDDWIGQLTSPQSPLAKQSDATLKRRPFRVLVDDSDAGEDDPSEAVACVCLARNCNDGWPLFESDALRFADKYLCNEVTKSDSGWEW